MSALGPALAALARGEIILLTGDRLRGGDVDLVAAASLVRPETINFMARYARGLICMAITPDRAVRLGLTLLDTGTLARTGRPFAPSIEAREGITTGISAADRALTIQIATSSTADAQDIVSPGHVFPLIAGSGGVAARPSATEAAVELCRMAGVGDAAVLCAVMKDDGSMARAEDLGSFLAEHGMVSADIGALIELADRNRHPG
ncbi:3,4-dihydroxy-2-butanone-4-phosphate synthase [Novosphingobium humi]|uniref:3,4-dihydroxy-2-butanone 4-phosphate synthase n=1 Tax=Novosphingobium humi TaxID=2282397 RepID=A0ABY7U6J5_9SPHN|nr:3,4-dihydroxy-2-butanone-4-phosphate synthase [Novosphingobium humi]WCT79964.1 3,4-dihydroxy-2-butanone-4-phosphate synthase [Novosphingobium humi]WJT00872.1 3,4-dihydroxy-2-butanone-4-phosphate synthase [Novosphingobium humi]